MPIFFLVLLFYFLNGAHVSADAIKKKDGNVLEGQILDQDSGYLYVDTPGGIVNLSKTNILEINGEPYDAGAVAQSAARYSTGRVLNINAQGLGLEKNLVAKVGEGGVGEEEFRWDLIRAGYKGIRHYKEEPAEARKAVLDKAIEDELLFQEALRLGYHEKDLTKKHIGESYKNDSQIAGIEPAQMQKDEIHAFYDLHPKLFMTPEKYQLKVLALNQSQVDVNQAKKNPASVKGWKSSGWVNRGDTLYLPFSDAVVQQIYQMKKGQTGEFKDSMNGRYLIWVTDYQTSKPIPFENAKEKVKHEMIKSKMAANTKVFDQKFKAQHQRVPTIDELFKEGLKAGKHRERMTREGIINAYLNDAHDSRENLASKLKQRYPVKVQLNQD